MENQKTGEIPYESQSELFTQLKVLLDDHLEYLERICKKTELMDLEKMDQILNHSFLDFVRDRVEKGLGTKNEQNFMKKFNGIIIPILNAVERDGLIFQVELNKEQFNKSLLSVFETVKLMNPKAVSVPSMALQKWALVSLAQAVVLDHVQEFDLS